MVRDGRPAIVGFDLRSGLRVHNGLTHRVFLDPAGHPFCLCAN